MRACVRAYVCACTSVRPPARPCVCVRACVYVPASARPPVRVRAYVIPPVRPSVRACTCVRVCVCESVNTFYLNFNSNVCVPECFSQHQLVEIDSPFQSPLHTLQRCLSVCRTTVC